MKLLKLQLTNFQGIKSFILEPNGMNASVFGTNAAGKTTLYNALTWLLFDKASTGEKGFSPKTKDMLGRDLHYLEHSVEGVFKLADSRIITFKKTLKEDWKKVRGSLEETFSGHKTEYFINGIPSLKYEFDKRLESIFTSLQAQVLTQPSYFPETMSWQERRKLLLEVCGDIFDEDVIHENEDKLGELPSTLLIPGTTDRFYTVDDFRKIASSKCKEINDKINAIPDRIDEAKRAMPDISNMNKGVIIASLDVLKKEKEELEAQKVAVGVTSVKQSIQKQIVDLQIEMIQKKSDHIKKHEFSVQMEKQRISSLENSLTQKNSLRFNEHCKLIALRNTLESVKRQREELNAEYVELKDKEWAPSKSFECETVCPTCGQAILEETISAAKKKHADAEEAEREQFNLKKSSRLLTIRTTVATNCSKEYIAQLEKDMADQEFHLAEIDGAISSLSDNIKLCHTITNTIS